MSVAEEIGHGVDVKDNSNSSASVEKVHSSESASVA